MAIRDGRTPHPGRRCVTEFAMVILTLGMWWIVPVVRYHVKGNAK